MPMGLSPVELDKIEEVIAVRRKIKRGATLFSNGEKFTSLYAIRTGFFKTCIATEDGRDAAIQSLPALIATELTRINPAETAAYRELLWPARQSLTAPLADVVDQLTPRTLARSLALTFLATQFRLALTAKEEGLRTQQQLQGHFAKLGVAMWPSRAQQVLETMSAFPRARLELAIHKMYQADKALRDRAPDDRIVLEDVVLALTSKN